jgi:hypothetical protein
VPDWEEIVHAKIDRLRLTESQREEVCAEIASHLEEAYEEQRILGLPAVTAVDQVLREVDDWDDLVRRVHRAKRGEGIVNNRTKQLWLPGLASFWTAMICEISLGGDSLTGNLFHSHETQLLYGMWLTGQLGCGALGAYLSRRAGGPRSARLAAALFTSSILVTTMAIVICICGVARAMGLGFVSLEMTMLVKPVIVVILVPSAAMFVGALPFLSNGKRMTTAP